MIKLNDLAVYFYWILWSIYLCLTLFFPYSLKKTLAQLTVLYFIVSVDKQITIEYVHIHLTQISMIIVVIIVFANSRYTLYELICACMMIIASASLLLWEKSTVIIFSVHSSVVLASLFSIFIVFLIPSLIRQLYVAIVSIPIGYLLYELILFSYYIQTNIGEVTMYIYLLLTVCFLVVFHFLKWIFSKAYQVVLAMF